MTAICVSQKILKMTVHFVVYRPQTNAIIVHDDDDDNDHNNNVNKNVFLILRTMAVFYLFVLIYFLKPCFTENVYRETVFM